MVHSPTSSAGQPESLIVTRHDRVITWELNRLEHDNGLDTATLEAMENSLTELEREKERLVCLLVTGQSTVFSTGLDSELLKTCFGDAALFRDVIHRVNRLWNRLEALPLVTIACIEGICRLGGLELALACDLIVAGENARINDGHVGYDAIPGGGATRRLPARVGYSAALRFILQNETLSAAEAVHQGLVDDVVPSGGALDRGRAIAADLARLHPSVVHATKTSLRSAAPQVTTRTETDEFQRVVIERLVSGQQNESD